MKIKTVGIPGSSRAVLLIRIPDSHLRPHQSDISKKFYRRFQLESAEMTEREVCDSYRSRFRNNDLVEQYIEGLCTRKNGIVPSDTIMVSAITIPASIERRLIETSDYRKFRWFRSVKMEPDPRYATSGSFFPSELEPCSHGLLSRASDPCKFRQTRIHRNGCIEYIEHVSLVEAGRSYFPAKYFAVRLMQLLQFTGKTLRHYNYLGDVRIMVAATCRDKSALKLTECGFPPGRTIDRLDCRIEREHPLQHVEIDHDKITSSIMDEIFNHYGADRCDMFDENGRIIMGLL